MTSSEELAAYLGATRSEVDGTKLVPMLCEREESAQRALGRPEFLYELKLDGVRILADKRGPKVRLCYRKLRDATASYPEIAKAVAGLAEERLVLDGEIVAFDEQGRPDFQRLGHRIQSNAKDARLRAASVPVVYVVFDVLAVGPYDVRAFPLEARKEILARVLPADGPQKALLRAHPTFEDGTELFRLCREHRLEGVVAKRLGSSYRAGERTVDWLKVKCELDAEFVVIGWTEGESTRSRLGALDLGAYEENRLVFRGRVGSGLDEPTIDLLLQTLLPIEVDHPVAEGKYSPKPKRHHCRPELVVSVRYQGFSLDPSGARFLRFPVFRGIRPDVAPLDCTVQPEDGIDLAIPNEVGERDVPDKGDAGPASTPSAAERARTRRLHVTGPEQPLLRDGTTKGALSAYFERVAPAMLHHVRGRACSLISVDGATLWPPPKWTPKFMRTLVLRAGAKEVRGYAMDSVDALLFAVEAATPTLAYGACLEGASDLADFVVLRVEANDLTSLREAARAVRTVADEVGLPAVALAAGHGAIDVLVGGFRASGSATAPLGTLMAVLARGRAGPAARITTANRIVAPFAPCLPVGGEATVVSLPIAWEELDEGVAGELRFGLAHAADRAERDDVRSALAPLDAVRVDLATAAEAIERAVAKLGA